MAIVEPVLAEIDQLKQAVTTEAEATRERIERFTARLSELDRQLEHLQITRATLLALPQDPETRAAAAPELPEHPAYQQILTVFADERRPLRARDLCESLDLGLEPKKIEGMRAKLKRLVKIGILGEPEPGLFAQTHP